MVDFVIADKDTKKGVQKANPPCKNTQIPRQKILFERLMTKTRSTTTTW
jgi:hypothetical protein